MTEQTIEEIRLFIRYSQLFLENKELNLLDVIGDISQKLIGKRLGSVVFTADVVKNDAGKNVLKNISDVSVVTATPGPVKIKTEQGTLIKSNVPSGDLVNKMVKVICMEGVEPNAHPKVKKMGPYFDAIVLEDNGDLLKVQVREQGFDPHVFSLPKEDVELK